MECAAWEEFRKLIDVAFAICQDQDSLEYAHLCVSTASVECESGRPQKAYPYMDKALRIRQRIYQADHEELANMYNNRAMQDVTWEMTLQSIEGAKSLLQKAFDIDYTKPTSESSKILHIRHLNMGLCYTIEKRFDEALDQVAIGQQYALEQFGKDSHFEAV
jgi:tetratricopeptide (TPR) repeat protein